MRTRLLITSALLGLLAAACAQSNAGADAADAELRDYQLHALEARVPKVPDGPDRDYFSGMLASRSGRFDDAI